MTLDSSGPSQIANHRLQAINPRFRAFLAILFFSIVSWHAPLLSAAAPRSADDFKVLPQKVIEQRLKSAPQTNRARAQTLKAMFEEAGCGGDRLSEEKLNSHGAVNLICKLPGEADSVILVGGHLDHVSEGAGIVDDWSGSSMLPSLYQSLAGSARRHTFVFIGFGEEEEGLRGSDRYVRQLTPGEVHRIRAMVNLECLGLGAPEVWADHADPRLLPPLDAVARSMKTWIPRVNLEWVGRDDAMSFRARGVPTITVHSLTQDTVGVLHTQRDRLSDIRRTYYYGTYRLVVRYLAALDRTLP